MKNYTYRFFYQFAPNDLIRLPICKDLKTERIYNYLRGDANIELFELLGLKTDIKDGNINILVRNEEYILYKYEYLLFYPPEKMFYIMNDLNYRTQFEEIKMPINEYVRKILINAVDLYSHTKMYEYSRDKILLDDIIDTAIEIKEYTNNLLKLFNGNK